VVCPPTSSPRSHAAPARVPAVPRATASRPALTHRSSEFSDVIGARAPLLNSLLSRGSVGGRFWSFPECTVERVRYFGFCWLTQPPCLSILSYSRAFSTLDPHCPFLGVVRFGCLALWGSYPLFGAAGSTIRILCARTVRLFHHSDCGRAFCTLERRVAIGVWLYGSLSRSSDVARRGLQTLSVTAFPPAGLLRREGAGST
jgi:hypothetical protein